MMRPLARWLFALGAILYVFGSAQAYWQSRLQVAIVTGGGGFVGPGNVVGSATAFWGLQAYTTAYASGLGKLANICTPADAVCADVNSDVSGNFNLAGTGSLTCNNSGSICTVKTLYDQTLGTACGSAVCDLGNTTAAARPVLIVAAAANGCTVTTQPCMGFAGAATINGTGSISLSQPFTYMIVGAVTGNTGAQQSMLVDGPGNAQVGFNNAGDNTWFMYSGTVKSGSAADSTFHAAQAVFNAGSSDLYIDGTDNSGAAGSGAVSGVPFMGSTGSLSQFLTGKISAAGIWPVDIASNKATMNSRLHSNWGF